MKNLFLFLFAMILFGMVNVQAQDKRAASPSSTLIQKVGLTDVTIEYSRPSMKGRTIFAEDGLVPFGKLWRTGANSATKITFSDAVTIGDSELAAGSYAILTKPGADSWDVNFYPYEASGWSSYSQKTPAVTIKASPQMVSNSVESFLITVDNLKDYSAAVNMLWDKTMVSFAIGVK